MTEALDPQNSLVETVALLSRELAALRAENADLRCRTAPEPQGQVYALLDPDTDLVYYIGQTIQPVSERVAHHLSPKASRRVHRWVLSLAVRKLSPLVEILAYCPSSQLIEREAAFIAAYLENGHPLLNRENPNADSVPFLLPTRPSKIAMSSSNTDGSYMNVANRILEILADQSMTRRELATVMDIPHDDSRIKNALTHLARVNSAVRDDQNVWSLV